jgi:hypothetical protein
MHNALPVSPIKMLRAVQSSPFPPCAARRRGGPGGGLGTPGLAPGPRPPRPHLRKKAVPRREADIAPHPSRDKLWVNQVLPVESPSYRIMDAAV